MRTMENADSPNDARLDFLTSFPLSRAPVCACAAVLALQGPSNRDVTGERRCNWRHDAQTVVLFRGSDHAGNFA